MSAHGTHLIKISEWMNKYLNELINESISEWIDMVVYNMQKKYAKHNLYMKQIREENFYKEFIWTWIFR